MRPRWAVLELLPTESFPAPGKPAQPSGNQLQHLAALVGFLYNQSETPRVQLPPLPPILQTLPEAKVPAQTS